LRSAAARTSLALVSGETRRFMRLLSPTAAWGIPLSSQIVRFQDVREPPRIFKVVCLDDVRIGR
jgi:hypothetical protein